jgi:hypothetical protein
MKNLKKLSRNELKLVTGGMPVGNGIYACCVGRTCSNTVSVNFYDDLSCSNGAILTYLGPQPLTLT